MDPRLRRNQLEILLKRRIFNNESEMYEMMRSRQVYQIQTDLHRELERTMKSIQHAEKLKFAAFSSQRAMFIKRANILERNKRHLTKVQGAHRPQCPVPPERRPKEKEKLFMTEGEESSTSTISTKPPAVVITHSENGDSDKVITDQQALPGTCRSLEKPSAFEKTGATVVTRTDSIQQELKKSIPAQSREATDVGKGNDGLWPLSSPNTQWMEEIKESKAKARARIRAQLQVSSANRSGRPASVGSRDGSRSKVTEGKSREEDAVTKRSGELLAPPQLTLSNEIPGSHEKGKDRIAIISLVHDTVKGVSTEKNTSILLSNKNSPIALSNKNSPIALSKKNVSIPLSKQNGAAVDLSQDLYVSTHRTPSDEYAFSRNIKPDQSGLATEQNETNRITQSNGDMTNNFDKQPRSVSATNETTVENNERISENDPRPFSQEGKRTPKPQLSTENVGTTEKKGKVKPPAGKPPRSHRPFGERSRESTVVSSTSIKEHEREVRRKKLPYFTKVTSHSARGHRKPKSRTVSPAHSLPSFFDHRERERTITMIFMEEKDNSEALPSAFDIEAWLLYNRKKRGYSIILESVKAGGENAEGDDKKSKKSRLKVSFQNSNPKLKKGKARSRNLAPKDNFRERSQAWYANFLQARREHKRKNPGAGGPTWSLPNMRYRHPTLPLLAQSVRAATISDGNDWKREVKVPHFSKETTETRLKQLRLETETLTDKVHNFVL